MSQPEPVDTNAGLLHRLNTDMDACGYSHYEMLGACGREDDTRSGDEAYSAYATDQPTVAPARARSGGGLLMAWYAAAAAAALAIIIALSSLMRGRAAAPFASAFGVRQ